MANGCQRPILGPLLQLAWTSSCYLSRELSIRAGKQIGGLKLAS